MLALIIIAIVLLSLSSMLSLVGAIATDDEVRSIFVLSLVAQAFAIVVLSLCI